MARLQHIILHLTAFLLTPCNPLLATNKLSQATWGSYDRRDHKGPGTYAYGYDIEDPVTGNVQFRQEERHADGTVTGSYGYVDAAGNPRVTHYVSDLDGYRILSDGTATPPQQDFSTSVTHGEHHETVNRFPSFADGQVAISTPSDYNAVKIDRFVHNPPPLIYELRGPPPFLTYLNAEMANSPLSRRQK